MTGTFFIGLGVGLLAGSLAAAALLHRHVRRTRAAERRAQAAERLAELGAMTSGLAHEIKNPLSTVSLNAQLLAEGVGDLSTDAEAKARLTNRVQALRRETERLRGILSDFLEFAGELRPVPAPTDLNALVEELAEFFRPEAQRQAVELRTDLTDRPLIAHVDARLLKQALLNLLLNATQAMGATAAPTGEGPASAVPGRRVGDLFVRTRIGRDDQRQRVAEVHVIDTGPGMAADVLENIFNPYYTTKAGGTGLGLPTSRRIIEAHHGRIEVHTEPGKGTDFTIILPLHDAG
ncbi:MAG: sensor histidine kinase [Phycisphaerales bacterium]